MQIADTTDWVLLCVGQGFETTGGQKGVILQLNDSGTIIAYQELWDRNYMRTNYPGTIYAMRPLHVLETNIKRNREIKPRQIKRIFLVLPVELCTAADMSGNGNFGIIGIVNMRDGAMNGYPFTVHGVQSTPPRKLLCAVYRHQNSFGMPVQTEAVRFQVQAQIEDAIRDAAWTRSEENKAKANRLSTVELRGLHPGQVLSVLRKLTTEDSYEVCYRANNLMLVYKDWDSLETIMGRNAKRTHIRSMNAVYEAGPPVFKWLTGPIERLVVSFSYFSLLNAAGTACITSNAGTDRARREKNAVISERRQCWFCLRRDVIDDPCSGCVCTELSRFGQQEAAEMDIDEDASSVSGDSP